MDIMLLLALLGGIVLLLVLILGFKVNAFISLLVASISIGIFAGMHPQAIIDNITKGMGNTLGFVAVVVGLGAILGAILEHSGATRILSDYMLSLFGVKNSGIALSISGFMIAIPVFFDVAFIILVPVLYALQKKTGKSLLFFALPLVSSLAVAHAFIPPTPGPIAVADILHADLGYVILFGIIVGIPTTIIAGMVYGRYISSKIFIKAPESSAQVNEDESDAALPSIGLIVSLIGLPLVLILANTILKAIYVSEDAMPFWAKMISFLGYPYIALLLTTFLAMYYLGIRYGATRDELQELSIKALGPAGIIILITGAGGVFKQMLIETGAGVMLAETMLDYHFPALILGFVIALIIRILQGSATVAMITAAGIMAPILESISISGPELALMVTAIAAGATGFSHVNDSGFWLVNRYLGMTEKQSLQSVTVMTGIISFSALIFILAIQMVIF